MHIRDSKARKGTDTPFPYLNKTWVYMVEDSGKTVKAYFTLPPNIKRQKDVRNDIDFTLFTRSQLEGVAIADPINLKNTSFDSKKPTKFITHGWLSSGTADTCVSIKDGYLELADVNVIIMNWKEIAGNYFYLKPMWTVPEIAAHYADFISDMIEEHEVNPKSIHLIGHSLGAQISGLVSRNMRGIKLGRVTGLDPAFPGFDNIVMHNDRISNESAEFVDVIHSCAGFLGVMDAVGHVDFYPNGGTMPQPGCSIGDLIASCSHGRSWQLFADSLWHPTKPFYAIKCSTWEDYRDKKCKNSETIMMGDFTPSTARGKFYLETGKDKPYSLGDAFH
ncbi:hypothetical protein HHI36_008489 [Cryptolaemus montrouzieri]|uniref:Lipase domain-containing protein n=1 Tax=Cryptolaemus montrouzieri TaxID=559131 RepID=A0ABD2MTE9_9CUCU